MIFFFQEKLFLNYNKLSVAEYRKNNKKKNDKILINIFGRGRHLCHNAGFCGAVFNEKEQ